MSLSKEVNQTTAYYGLAQPSNYCCAYCSTQATEIVKHGREYQALCDTHFGISQSISNNINDNIKDNPVAQHRIPSKRYCWACLLKDKKTKPITTIDVGFGLPVCYNCKEEDDMVNAYCWGIEIIPWNESILKAYEESLKPEYVQ